MALRVASAAMTAIRAKDLPTQQRFHPIFKTIRRGDAELAWEMILNEPTVLDQRDNVGAAPIHSAFLYGQAELGKEIVRGYPQCCTYQYTGQLYTGENILHIVIMARDVYLADWLLQREPTLLNAEAVGDFFRCDGNAYLGGLPLLFAVSTNQFYMVRKMLAVRAAVPLRNSVFATDRFGNGALHLAVVHDLPQMYDFILEIAETEIWERVRRRMDEEAAQKAKVEDLYRFSMRPNDEKLSPLALAAAMGRVRMFEHILGKNTRTQWVYGPIQCKLIPLRGFEQPMMQPNGKATDEMLAIDCICAGSRQPVTHCLQLYGEKVSREVRAARLELVTLDAVKQLLDRKWETFGRDIFFRKLLLMLATQLLWLVSTILPGHYRLAPGNLSAYPIHNTVILVCEGLMLLAVAQMFNRASYALWIRQRLSKAFRYTGATSFEYSLELYFCVLYMASLMFRLLDRVVFEDIVAAGAALIGWFRMLFFLLGFRSTGPFIIMIKEMVRYDMRRLGMVYLVMLVGYTMALNLVRHAGCHPSIGNALLEMKSLLLLVLTGQYPTIQEEDYWLVDVLLISYILLGTVLLLNLLIAMMGNTYSEVANDSERRWYVERAGMMSSFATEFSVRDMQAFRCKYAEREFASFYDPMDVHTDLFLKITVRDPKWKEVVLFEEKEFVAREALATTESAVRAQLHLMLLHPDRYPSSLAPDGSPRHFSFTFRSPRPPPPAATAPPALAPPDPAAGAGAADGATLYARRTQAAPPALRDDPPPSPKLTPVSAASATPAPSTGSTAPALLRPTSARGAWSTSIASDVPQTASRVRLVRRPHTARATDCTVSH